MIGDAIKVDDGHVDRLGLVLAIIRWRFRVSFIWPALCVCLHVCADDAFMFLVLLRRREVT